MQACTTIYLYVALPKIASFSIYTTRGRVFRPFQSVLVTCLIPTQLYRANLLDFNEWSIITFGQELQKLQTNIYGQLECFFVITFPILLKKNGQFFGTKSTKQGQFKLCFKVISEVIMRKKTATIMVEGSLEACWHPVYYKN